MDENVEKPRCPIHGEACAPGYQIAADPGGADEAHAKSIVIADDLVIPGDRTPEARAQLEALQAEIRAKLAMQEGNADGRGD